MRDLTRKLWLFTGAAVSVGLLSAWLTPSTAIVQHPSALANLSAQAAAEKPSLSPVADNLIPSNVAMKPEPLDYDQSVITSRHAAPVALADEAPTNATPAAAAGPAPADEATTSEAVRQAPDDDTAMPTPPAPAAQPTSPDPDYAAKRAAWQASMAAYRRDAGGE